MNALLTSATLIVIASNCAAVTQDGNEEEQQAVRAFPTEFDQAVSSRDDEAPKKWK